MNVIIGKAAPELKITASDIDYGSRLADSSLTGEARHPVAGTTVAGTFAWLDDAIVPTVPEAAGLGYSVMFTPTGDDANNYTSATAMVTLTVNKVDSSVVTAPAANDFTYDGSARELITGGSASGGTMKYWIDGDENNEYSSTVPSRTNAGTYTVRYTRSRATKTTMIPSRNL